MQFREGTSVYSFDGRHVGRVDRVVLNPKTKEVTDIVVRKGHLFAEDKTVPLRFVVSATENRVTLSNMAKLDHLPTFKEIHYIPLNDAEVRAASYPSNLAAALFWNPPRHDMMGYPNGLGYPYPPQYRVEADQNLPEGTIALQENIKVFNSDNQNIGNVTRIYTEASDNRASHFLLSEGLVFKHEKLIPVSWIREIQEDGLYLGVGNTTIDQLPEFQEA